MISFCFKTNPIASVSCLATKNLTVARHVKTVPADVEKAIKKRLLRKDLKYSTHARRRIEYRDVTPEDIVEVLQHGVINKDQSKFGGQRSPTFCLEKWVGEPQKLLRVVFAQGDNATIVVTVTWKERVRR